MSNNQESENPIVSLRLPTKLTILLRGLAEEKETTISDILREAAWNIICEYGLCTCPNCPKRKKST